MNANYIKINKKALLLFLPFVLALNITPAQPTKENGSVLINDGFSTLSSYTPVYLEGAAGGNDSVVSEALSLKLSAANTVYAMANPTAVSGHFYAEVAIDQENFAGLALIRNNNGVPDRNNYTSINVSTSSTGVVAVEVLDRQFGVANVLDNTKVITNKATRYKTELRNQYSVPFTSTGKRVRIFRDDLSGFFHFYYSVKKQVNGQWYEDWMELAPSKDWNPKGSSFFVAPLVRSGSAATASVSFDNLLAVQKPTQDLDDRQTGFLITKRDYNWSGQTGNAYVVSFGDHFKYRKDDIKFVFWDQANWVPVWHMNNQLLYCYEFVETWSSIPGCFEPMSDRLRAFGNVSVLEDNKVRKVIKWNYSLVNPDYLFPSKVGSQSPDVEEIYTIYPDGTGLRHIKYKAKLDDPSWSNWNELEESIVISGTQTNPSDHVAPIPLTLTNLAGNIREYDKAWYNANKAAQGKNFETYERKTIEGWQQMIQAVHFNNAPDAYNVFSNSSNFPDIYSGFKATTDIDWHSYDYKMSHWPVNKEPYQEAHKSLTSWTAQVSHTSLASVEHWNDGSDGYRWTTNFKKDTDGRKYREWVSLIGLNDAYKDTLLRNKTATWLYPGTVKVLNSATTAFLRFDYYKREIILSCLNDTRLAQFSLDPSRNKTITINPTFRIKNFGSSAPAVYMDNVLLSEGTDYETAHIDNDLLIWLNKSINQNADFEISDGTSDVSQPSGQIPDYRLENNFPNPFNPTTTISYQIAEGGRVSLRVFDVLGKEVARLVDGFQNAGRYSVDFDASALSSGIYLYKLEANDFIKAGKMVVTK